MLGFKLGAINCVQVKIRYFQVSLKMALPLVATILLNSLHLSRQIELRHSELGIKSGLKLAFPHHERIIGEIFLEENTLLSCQLKIVYIIFFSLAQDYCFKSISSSFSIPFLFHFKSFSSLFQAYFKSISSLFQVHWKYISSPLHISSPIHSF